jgi:hypothetical protein
MGSPALSMNVALLRFRTTENPLGNEDRCAGWRPGIIESAGEPVSGMVSSTINGTVTGHTTGTGGTIRVYIT